VCTKWLQGFCNVYAAFLWHGCKLFETCLQCLSRLLQRSFEVFARLRRVSAMLLQGCCKAFARLCKCVGEDVAIRSQCVYKVRTMFSHGIAGCLQGMYEVCCRVLTRFVQRVCEVVARLFRGCCDVFVRCLQGVCKVCAIILRCV